MLDDRDKKILVALQANADVLVNDLADEIGLSPSACSRRISRLKDEGYIRSTVAVVDRAKINLPSTIFLLVRAGHHTEDWLETFNRTVRDIAEVTEVHRLTGNYDYILKLSLPNVEYYDEIYKQITRRVKMFDMSAYISMETVKASPSLPVHHI